MMTTSRHVGHGDEFVALLRRSNLIERGALEQMLSGITQTQRLLPTPERLADMLVEQRVLTRFQADRVLAGQVDDLVQGPYVLEESIGSGNLGPVFRARGRTDGRQYAVKLLPRRSMWNVRMARRYVRACELVKHPAVVPFVDVGTSGGHHYLAWPLIVGETLAARVAREGPLAPETAAYYAERVADALAACHEEGLVHGLVNPANVMIGADEQVYLLDSGIGALLAQSGDEQSLIHTLGQTSLLTGGVDCGSPESILDPAQRTAAGDQYSLGCTLFFLLTGRFPFEGPPVQKMTAHQFEAPPDLCDLVPEIPDELTAIVARLLQKSPAHRFAQAADVAEALRFLAVAPEPRHEAPPKLPTRGDLVDEPPMVDEPPEAPTERAPAVRGGDRVSSVLIGVILVVGVLAGLAAGWLLK